MTFVNNNKPQYDLPQWYPMSPTPVATPLATCTADDGSNNALYAAFAGAAFYKWDSAANGWQQLANLPTAAVTSISLKYSKFAGYRGNTLGATANTMTLAPVNPAMLVGQTIRIMSGAGAGQDRTISAATPVTVWDKGLITGVTASTLVDATKNWKINQWVGYQIRVVHGTGQSIIRKVLYNDQTTLYLQDSNYQQLEPWQNTTLYTAAPYTLPVATAGSQAHYTIETADITLSTPWTVQPDATSSFVILTGGIFALTANASAPWSTLYYYDCLLDSWTQKTAIGGHLVAALTGDWSLERTGEVGGVFLTGTATSATSTSLTSTALSMGTDRYTNHQLRITGGTGMGQRRRILTNTSNKFNIEKPWTVQPDATSTFSILGSTNTMYLSGNNQATIHQYNIEEDIWSPSNVYCIGIARQGSVTFGGQEGIGITSITRNGGGITAINPTPTAGGSGYSLGDILTFSASGTLGKAKVTGITSAGAVTSVMLYGCGSGYVTGTGLATTGGTGTACTLAITSVGIVGRVVTAMNHNLAIGDSFVASGATEALWNAQYTVLGCDSLTAFDIATTATANWVATQAQTVSILVDSTQNWTVNEHAGRLVTIQVAGTAPTTQIRKIVSNTATTLTLNANITAAVNGTSRYVIHEPHLPGRATQYPVSTQGATGYATSGSTTTLVDSTKNWTPGQWVGYKFRIINGTGAVGGNEIAITANSETTLTYTTQTFTPDATTKYMIMDTFGSVGSGTTTTITDTTKKWAVNQFAGKRVRIASGLGAGQELLISSNTATVLTFGAGTAPDATSTYCILESQARGVGSNLNWIFGNTNTSTQGKYISCFFGGGTNLYGRYDVTTELWEITQVTSPQSELLNTGSGFAYSGKNRIYYQVNSTGRCGYIDVNTMLNYVMPALLQAPLGTALAGNRFEVITTSDGIDILVLLDNSGQRMWRSIVLFY
jgi:hypothetical protein